MNSMNGLFTTITTIYTGVTIQGYYYKAMNLNVYKIPGIKDFLGYTFVVTYLLGGLVALLFWIFKNPDYDKITPLTRLAGSFTIFAVGAVSGFFSVEAMIRYKLRSSESKP